MKRSSLILLATFGATVVTAPFWVSHLVWRQEPWRAQRVQLVDYTVPFVSGREHRGAAWLLNYEKYRAASASHWAPMHSYAGYDPTDRAHFRPISSLDLSGADWLFVADTYGVYTDDLKGIENEEAHSDFSRRIVGGLSVADAEAIAAHAARGHHTLLEFNAIEEPTSPEARAMLESLFGIHWTGWTGRTFIDLRDTTDVPHWLPRVHREQYGDVPLPRGPTLALVHRSGRLLLMSVRFGGDPAPTMAVTARGARVMPDAEGGARYHYWFPILEAAPGTEVLAELVFPATAAMDSLRAIAAVPARVPLLTRRVKDGAHRIYLAGDLSDTDFDPGAYSFAGLARVHAAVRADPRIYASQLAFWKFYVPAVSRLLQAPFDRMAHLAVASAR